MMRFIVGLLGRLSGYLKLDVLYRICGYLSHYERRILTLRLLRDEAERITFRRDGVLWTGFAWDEDITWSLFISGGFQSRQIQALLSWMESRGRFTANRNVIVDVGANIGTSTVPFVQRTNCHILAIEPVTENFTVLQQNVRQNGLEERVTCIQAAIFNRRDVAQMVLSTATSGGAEFKQPGSEPGFAAHGFDIGRVIQVPTDTLIGITKSCQILPEQIAFVWSDTQGSEGHVIESGEPLWLAGVPLYMELDPDLLRIQNSLKLLMDLAVKFFDRFVESDDLVRQRMTAEPRPISELAALIDVLDRNSTIVDTDVLLLPPGYEFPIASKLEF